MINATATFICQSEFDDSEQDKAQALFLYQTTHVCRTLIEDEFPKTYANNSDWCPNVIIFP